MVVNKKQLPPKEATAVLLLSLNCYILLAFYGLRVLLGNVQPQGAVFEFSRRVPSSNLALMSSSVMAVPT